MSLEETKSALNKKRALSSAGADKTPPLTMAGAFRLMASLPKDLQAINSSVKGITKQMKQSIVEEKKQTDFTIELYDRVDSLVSEVHTANILLSRLAAVQESFLSDAERASIENDAYQIHVGAITRTLDGQ